MEALTDWGSTCGGGLLEAWILAELAGVQREHGK